MTSPARRNLSGRLRRALAGAALAGASLLALPDPARAQAADEPSGPAIAWNVAVTSDYVFRGVSQTEEDAAISGGVDLEIGAFYTGAWASNVAFPGDPDTEAEIDLYAGYRTSLAGWDWDFGAGGYFYAGQPDGADYDYMELKAAASRAYGPVTLGATLAWSPDFFGAAEDEATYLEANAAFEPADKWTISGAVGRQVVSSEFDYTTWNLGVARQLTDTLALDLRYHDTDAHDFGDIYGARAVASLKAAF
jgi:uncharacterized protein (TIGR02001 family)